MDKILYISYDGLTDILGKSQILPYIVGLTKYGYAFTIISFEKRHRKERLESDINNIIKGLPIDWVPLTYHRNPPILSSIFDYITLLIKSIYLHKQNNFSLELSFLTKATGGYHFSAFFLPLLNRALITIWSFRADHRGNLFFL